MKLRILSTLIFAFIFSCSFSQTLKGKVTDAITNTPLIGATISVGAKVTTTDNAGMFSIDCSRSKQITVTFIGYQSFNEVIKNCNEELRVSLLPSKYSLNDIEIT